MTLRFSRKLRIFFNENHDHCTLCKSHFNEGELTHLGYKTDQSFIYACNNCRSEVAETVVRYGYSKRSYIVPPNDSFLWRYLDFSKFVSMLMRKALFFSKSSLFTDPFEGAIGILDNKERYDRSELFALIVAIMTAPSKDTHPTSPSKEIIDKAMKIVEDLKDGNVHDADLKLVEQAQKLSSQMSELRPTKREFTFINCWHENAYESDAMWTLYSKDISNAIAVRTTYQKLYLALDKEPSIQIGRVNYIDYNKNFSATNSAQWYKRFSFSHEKEVRAVLIDQNSKHLSGIEAPVNLDILIDKIYVSPYAQQWFVEIVQDILSKYGIEKEVMYSDLAKKPLY